MIVTIIRNKWSLILPKPFHKYFSTSTPLNTDSPKRVSHKTAIDKFFLDNEHLSSIKSHIPEAYLSLKKKGTPDHLYLICPNVAKTIASYVNREVRSNEDQVIAETNAGLGLISTELLESGVKRVRLYESCPQFRLELKDFANVYPGRVELFTKDIFLLHRLAYMDSQDNGNRVPLLLRNVAKRSWDSEPVMTIVGPMASISFLYYLVKCICLQKDIVAYGRFQIFAIMKPKHYAILSATPQDNLLAYQYWTILLNTIFDYKFLTKVPRNVFFPWESRLSNGQMNRYPTNLDPDKLYLVKLTFKKSLPFTTEQMLPLYYFGKYFYRRGKNFVIPTIEKWIPGCGLNILLPTLYHSDYFENMSIFTHFRELTPSQILAVFKEMVNYHSFSSSTFTAMMESELLKSETTETDLAEAMPLEKNMEAEIEQKLDMK